MTTSAFIQPLGMAHNPKAAAQFIARTFNEGAPDQYKRELVWNGVQAGAHNIQMTAIRLAAGPDDGDDAQSWGVKAAFVDDGVGMAAGKITDYIGELFNGASIIGPDGNFQMGARVSTLPFNHAGILVASWTEDDPTGTLLEIAYDPESETYGVVPQRVGEHWAPTGTPPAYLRHPIIERAGHGTAFILLGGDMRDHTVGRITRDPATGGFHYPTTRNTRDDRHYINGKFWALPDGVNLALMWGPQDLAEWAEQIPPGHYFEQAVDGPRKFTRRHYKGLRRVIEESAGEDNGTVTVTSSKGYRATVHWALFPESKFVRNTDAGGGESSTSDYDVALGLFGERLGEELYAVRTRGHARVPMEHYGISRRELRDRLVLVVEPERPSASFIGAVPSGARDRLLIANAGLPHEEWGAAFADKMPDAILERLRELNGETSKDDAERQKRITDRLREFFGRPLRRRPDGETPITQAERLHNTPRETSATRQPTGQNHRGGTGGRRSGFGAVAVNEGADRGEQSRMQRPREISPVWSGEEFAERPALIVHYVEATRTLYLNDAHPVIREVIRSEQIGRRESKADEIAGLAKAAIADYLIGAIVSAELYTTSALTGGEPVGTDFVRAATSDHALTAACLNVATLEHHIRSRFQGRAGFKWSDETAENRRTEDDGGDDVAVA